MTKKSPDKPEFQRYAVSFHGSRTLSDERVKIIVLEEIEKHKPSVVVTHAEPGGVCEVVRTVCKSEAVPLKLHFLNFKYLRGAFERRSKAVLNDSDFGIFIHDGKSKGTSNELKLAKKMKIPYTQHELEPAKFESSIGFDIDQDWDIEDVIDKRDIV